MSKVDELERLLDAWKERGLERLHIECAPIENETAAEVVLDVLYRERDATVKFAYDSLAAIVELCRWNAGDGGQDMTPEREKLMKVYEIADEARGRLGNWL